MSQTKNKIKWCLNKAEKEGKKHRGLKKIESSIEDAKKYIEKAEHNLRAIDYFKLGGYGDWSFSAGFYSIYHCFLAILTRFGYESRNQECTIALVEGLSEDKKIEIKKELIETLKTDNDENKIISLREEYQYGMETHIKEEHRLSELKELCKEAIETTKEIIYGK